MFRRGSGPGLTIVKPVAARFQAPRPYRPGCRRGTTPATGRCVVHTRGGGRLAGPGVESLSAGFIRNSRCSRCNLNVRAGEHTPAVTDLPDSRSNSSCFNDGAADQPAAPAGNTQTAKVAALAGVLPATSTLVSLWLGEQGWEVCDLDLVRRTPHVIIAEVSFPRTMAPRLMSSVAASFPAVPVVVLSPTVVAGTPVRGDAARRLGVAAVLGVPVTRAELLATIHELTSPG